MLLVLLVIAARPAGAASTGDVLAGTGEGLVDDKPVSARVAFRVVEGNLEIVLQHTGTRSDYTPAQVLTDISFNMSSDDVSWDVASSSVVVGEGSILSRVVGKGKSASRVEHEAGFDVSAEWGLAQGATLPSADGSGDLGPFDFSVTAAALGDADHHRFAGGNLNAKGRPKLAGGDFGLINRETGVDPPSLSGASQIIDSVRITLVPTADSDPLNLGMIVTEDERVPTFSFGSAHTGVVGVPDEIVPSPSGLAFGAGAFVMLSLGRRGRRRRGDSSISEEVSPGV